MQEQYKLISEGWLFQTNLTGEIMKYDYKYSSLYDSPAYSSNPISQIRFNYCIDNIEWFESVLDVGYGNGSFLKYCQDRNIDSYGYDISDYPVPENVTRVDDINIEVDLVTFFDCIEHFPQEDIENILLKLKCKYLCISLPWCHFTDDLVKFENWKHRKPNEHFHHFDQRGLTTLMNKADFDVIVCGSPEDEVRKNYGKLPNILTMIGKKRG